MWPFNKQVSLADSGIFQGFTDWHCHLLPGVDDGVQTMEESLQILAIYEKLGIREVWLTPHIMEDIPNTTADLRTRFKELQAAYHGTIDLYLSAENMLDPLFEKRLKNNDLLPFGKSGNYLLVETSYFNPPMGLKNILIRIKTNGYYPILAHPERYVYMNEENYKMLKLMDVKFQLDLPSLVGAYGSEAKTKALWLLNNGCYNFIGNDTHHFHTWEIFVSKKIPESISQKLKGIHKGKTYNKYENL